MLKLLLSTVFVFLVCICGAQVKIGSNATKTVDPSAVLELSNDLTEVPSSWKTFLPPQVDFTNPVFISSGIWGVSGTAVKGAVVFNVGQVYDNGFSGPGLYCWMGNRWSPFSMGDDKLRRSLSSSLQAYDTSADNTWVMITEAEYNNLLVTVSGAGKYAANDSFMNLSSTSGWNQLYTVGGNASVPLIPPSSYIIAWSIRTGSNFNTNGEHSKVKVSSSQLTGYSDYGLGLGNYALTMDTRYHFILKNPVASTGPLPSYTAVYAFHSRFLGSRPLTPGRDYFTPGESATLNNAYNSQSAMQFICTQSKQW